MENNYTPEPQKNDEVKISKKTLYIAAGILGILLLSVGLLFAFKDKNEDVKTVDQLTIKGNADSLKTAIKDSAKLGDSVKIAGTDEYGEEEGSPYSEYRVIARTVNFADQKLGFGEKVYVDENKSTENSKVVYLQNPELVKNTVSYSMSSANFIDSYRFDEYQKNFSLPPFSELLPPVKKLLLDENYSDGNRYDITQNAERAKSSIAFGDFDGDGLRDAAVIMDNNEKQISHLIIICTNSATKLPYVAFEENYSDKVRVNSFRKGSKVFMNYDELQPSPEDGIIIQSEDAKLSVIYDRGLQKFKTFSQEPYSE